MLILADRRGRLKRPYFLCRCGNKSSKYCFACWTCPLCCQVCGGHELHEVKQVTQKAQP